MEATFNGIKIKLTPEQIQAVTTIKNEVESVVDTGFIAVLKHYGFKKITYKERPDLCCYNHPVRGWFADIIDRKTNSERVFMVGNGLKDSHLFPGGWVYWGSPELNEELSRATSTPLLTPK